MTISKTPHAEGGHKVQGSVDPRFVAGPLGTRKKRNSIAHKEVPRGALQKNDTCLGLALLCMGSHDKCHLRVGVKGRSEGTPQYT